MGINKVWTDNDMKSFFDYIIKNHTCCHSAEDMLDEYKAYINVFVPYAIKGEQRSPMYEAAHARAIELLPKLQNL